MKMESANALQAGKETVVKIVSKYLSRAVGHRYFNNSNSNNNNNNNNDNNSNNNDNNNTLFAKHYFYHYPVVLYND